MKQMTPAAVERAMKLQDVMLRAMAKRITWFQAAETGDQLSASESLTHPIRARRERGCLIGGGECRSPSGDR
ncbi:MAG TPA: hypothetical protein VJU86_02600 [Pyrinomonadaceae bacterium]|nr:hypothetical protein [Pyrinomonadaceae bacterium]